MTRLLHLPRGARLVLGYGAIVLLMTWPLTNLRAIDSAVYDGDAQLIVWTLAWDNHAALDWVPPFDSNIFYPAPSSLRFNDPLFGLSLFTLPIYAATRNPVLAYNVVWLLSFLLSALAMHALAVRHTRSGPGAVVAALVFTFSFYKMLHAPGHLSLIWTWLVPLSLVLLDRWADRPTVARAAAWAGVTVLQVLSAWYVGVMAVATIALRLVWLHVTVRRDRWPQRVGQVLLVGAVGAALVWPLAAPYRSLAPRVAEVARYSADWTAYLMPPENTWMGQWWLANVGRGPRWIWEERTLYLGWIAMLLAAVGVVTGVAVRERRSSALFFLLLLAGGVALSFGPSTGRQDATLFDAVGWLPGIRAIRAPARFSLLALLGLAMLASHGAAAIGHRFGRRGVVVLTMVMPLMLSEWYLVGLPAGHPQPLPIPAIYRSPQLASARALVSLPDYRDMPQWFVGARYLYYSTAHWRPIVNGFGRSEPDDYLHVISHMKAFPGPNNAATMRRLGVDFVIFHAAEVAGGEEYVRVAKELPYYELVEQIGSDYLFKVRP